MESMSTEHLILLIVFTIQAIVVVITVLQAVSIGSLFAKDVDDYHIVLYEQNQPHNKANNYPLIKSENSHARRDQILGRANSYLIANYRKNRPPNIELVETLIRNQARVKDSQTSLFASFPILIGLAGTIIGLLYAFSEIDRQNLSVLTTTDNPAAANFLSLISKSSSIVFWGSFFGILFSIALNFILSKYKLQRDTRVNNLIFFIHSKISPELPSVREETVSLIVDQLSIFSESYFDKFRLYAVEFDRMTNSIKTLYEYGFKNIIEKNTVMMEKLIQTIETLDNLNQTAKSIRFKPEMFREFIYYSQELIKSNSDYVQKIDQYGSYFNELNASFKNLQERVNSGVIDLATDRNLIADFKAAMDDFRTSTVERTKQMSNSAKAFDDVLNDYRNTYKISLEEIKDSLLENVKKSVTPDDYVTFLEKLSSVSSSLEVESNNIKQLGDSLIILNEKITKDLHPTFSALTATIDKLNTTVEYSIPNSLSETVKTNKRLILETSVELLKEPRSWGQWSFLGVRKMFSKDKSRANGSGN